MKILDHTSNKPLKNICIYLTEEEASQMISYLENLLKDPSDANHAHMNNSDYSKEITLTIYDEKNLKGYDERSRKLILEDI